MPSKPNSVCSQPIKQNMVVDSVKGHTKVKEDEKRFFVVDTGEEHIVIDA